MGWLVTSLILMPSLALSNGELYFGSIYGYNVFRPDALNIADTDQEVIITKFKLNGAWLKPGDEGSPLKMPISRPIR